MAHDSILTDDMTLAAVLSLHGYKLKMIRIDGQERVHWKLDKNHIDGPVTAIVQSYHRGDCRVEPQEFMQELSTVRKKLYRFLGIAHQAPGTRVESAA